MQQHIVAGQDEHRMLTADRQVVDDHVVVRPAAHGRAFPA